jgi:4-amino-4-deoxy-L-arabinose transferase-like glycosyltransferase
MATSCASLAGKRNPFASPRCLLASIVLVAFALRLAVTQLPNFENLMDADHIHAWEPGNVAEALLAGRGFGSPFQSNQLSAVMPPVYPVIVAGLFRVFGIHTSASIFAAHALNCIFSALACIPVFLVARHSFGTRTAWWAAWAWALSPYGIYFAASWAWSTHLLLLCLCWLIYLAQMMEQSPRLTLWAGFGLLAGFAGLTEPSILSVIPLLMAVACWRLHAEKKRWFIPGVVASITLAATLSPWMIRNALVFHRLIPMRDSMGLEMWMGNNGYTQRWTSDQLHPLHDANELADYNRMGEIAYMDHKQRQADAFIQRHPEWFVWMSLRRAIYLWTGYWSFDRSYLAMEPTDPANIPFATSLTMLALAGLILTWRETPWEAIRYGGVLFLFPAIYYFSHPEPYHMRPLDPIMILLGCSAVAAWRARARQTAEIAETIAAIQEA